MIILNNLERLSRMLHRMAREEEDVTITQRDCDFLQESLQELIRRIKSEDKAPAIGTPSDGEQSSATELVASVKQEQIKQLVVLLRKLSGGDYEEEVDVDISTQEGIRALINQEVHKALKKRDKRNETERKKSLKRARMFLAAKVTVIITLLCIGFWHLVDFLSFFA